jgi:uncharacterized membrane protein
MCGTGGRSGRRARSRSATASWSAPSTARDGRVHYFQDFQRRAPLAVRAIAFVAAVVACGRWRGLRALLALGCGLVVVVRFAIGRDHVASTVNTLVLAYAGASLPLLIFLHAVGAAAG